jgi:hypothetical protein
MKECFAICPPTAYPIGQTKEMYPMIVDDEYYE